MHSIRANDQHQSRLDLLLMLSESMERVKGGSISIYQGGRERVS
jgi:hypothetical protein